MRQPAVVDQRTGGGELSVQQGGQLLQRLEIRLVLDAPAAGDDHLRTFDGVAGILLGSCLQHLIVRVRADIDGLGNELAGSTRPGLNGLEHHRPYRRHLRTGFQDDNVGQNAATVGGGRLIEYLIPVEAEVDRIGGQTGLQRDHHARGEVTPERSGRIQDNGRLVLFGKLGQRSLIGAGAVGGQSLVLGEDDAVGAVGKERFGQRGDAVPQQNRSELFTGVFLELQCFGKNFQHSGVQNAVLLFGKHPYSLIIFFCHISVRLLKSGARHAACLQAERLSLRWSRRNILYRRCAWAVPEPPW